MAALTGRYYAVGDPEVRDNWDKRIYRQYIMKTVIFNPKYKLVKNEGGGDENALCLRKKEAFKEGGTRATITMTKKLVGSPTHGNQTMWDREEGIGSATFRWEITKIRHAVRVDGEIVENRVTWNVIKTSSQALGEWFAERQEAAAAMHLCGFTINAGRPTTEPWHDGTDIGATWGNTPSRPDADHYLTVNDKNPEDFANTDIIDVPMLSDAVALAATYPQPIRPIRMYGDDYFIWFVHPYTVRHWKDSGTRWWEVAKAAIQGGQVNGNPIIRGTVGVYENVAIMVWPYLPPAINSGETAAVANTRHAVFCGQAALLYGVAKRYPDENTFRRVERDKDYGDKVGVEAHTLGGLATPEFDINGTTQRFSTIVMAGYAKDQITPA